MKILVCLILVWANCICKGTDYFEKLPIGTQKQAKNLLYFNKNGAVSHSRVQANVLYKSHGNADDFSSMFARLKERYQYEADFVCRHPSLHYFFSETLKLSHNFDGEPTPCNTLDRVPLRSFIDSSNVMTGFTDLPLHRLYQVAILQVTPSNAMKNPAGSFGHTMLRLAFCAPERAGMSEDCLKDVEHHLTVGYMGDTQNMSVSILKGLNGSYPSRLFVNKLLDVVDRYNVLENRALRVYPIDESFIDRKMLLYRIVENAYLYQGDYYYLWRNCVTELLDLLKSASNNVRLHQVSAHRPSSFIHDLLALDMIRDEGQNPRAMPLGYYWPEAEVDTQRILGLLRSYDPDLQLRSFADFYRKLPKYNQQWMEKILLQAPREDKKKVANLLFRLELLRSKRYFAKRIIYIYELRSAAETKSRSLTETEKKIIALIDETTDPAEKHPEVEHLPAGLLTLEEWQLWADKTQAEAPRRPANADSKGAELNMLLYREKPKMMVGFQESSKIRKWLLSI